MAKVKLAAKNKKPDSKAAQLQQYQRAIPCLFVIVGGMALIFAVLYFSMQSAGR